MAVCAAAHVEALSAAASDGVASHSERSTDARVPQRGRRGREATYMAVRGSTVCEVQSTTHCTGGIDASIIVCIKAASGFSLDSNGSMAIDGSSRQGRKHTNRRRRARSALDDGVRRQRYLLLTNYVVNRE